MNFMCSHMCNNSSNNCVPCPVSIYGSGTTPDGGICTTTTACKSTSVCASDTGTSTSGYCLPVNS